MTIRVGIINSPALIPLNTHKMIQTSRRDFLKIGALGAGSILASSALSKLYAKDPLYKRHGIKKLPTYCEVCFWKCAAWVHFDRNGDPYKLTGNEQDPLFCQVFRAFACDLVGFQHGVLPIHKLF